MRPETRRALNVLVAAALVGWLVTVVVTYPPVKPPPPPELKVRGGPVYFVPLGATDPPFLDSVAAHLEQQLPAPRRQAGRAPLDESVVDNRRRQLVAEALIALMRRGYPREAEDGSAVLIGITAHDLYIASYTKWRWAFSFRMDERFAGVSTARMDDAAWGGAPDAQRLEVRLRKMVTKNLGVLYFGLDQTSDRRSVMFGPTASARTFDPASDDATPARRAG
jgi:predicted Zn-dependent protease